jgi:hypothetical protein
MFRRFGGTIMSMIKKICLRLKRGLLLGLLVLLILYSQGCCSIIATSHKTIQVTSNPSGADVKIFDWNGQQVSSGKAPFTVTLKRGNAYFKPAKYEFKASLPGQPVRVVGFKSGINPWYWGNILLGGLIGMLIVDPITGAMWEPPDQVHINFNSPTPTSMDRLDTPMLYDERDWIVVVAQHLPPRE